MKIESIFTLLGVAVLAVGCSTVNVSEDPASVQMNYENQLFAGHPVQYDLSTRDPDALMSAEEFPASNKPPYF